VPTRNGDVWDRRRVANSEAAALLRVCFVNHRTTEEDVRAIPGVVGRSDGS
jgi:hypothetical protein